MVTVPESEKNSEMEKELEIRSILEERQQMADDEQMKFYADKYRAKPKVEEIFSNADKKPRLRNENPLELEAREKRKKELAEAASQEKEKEAEKEPEPQAESESVEKEAAAPEKADAEAQPEGDEPVKNTIVTLTPEYDEDTQFSGEVLDELEQFRETPDIKTFNTIDIDIAEGENAPSPEGGSKAEEAPQNIKAEEAPAANAEHVFAKVPVYRPEGQANILNVKAGRFAEVVSREYETYLHSKNPTVIAHVIRPEPKAEEPSKKPRKPEKNDPRSTQEKIMGALVGSFSKEKPKSEPKPKEPSKPVEDYTCADDESSIMYELKENIHGLIFRTVLSGVIALVSIVLTFITRVFPESIIAAIPVAPAAYGVFNLLLMGSAVALNRVSFLSGLTPLLRLKGNSDTAVSAAGVSALFHIIVSFFCLGDMSQLSTNYYCSVVLLAFFANSLGKLLMVKRVRDNFRFLTAKGQKYAAKIYNNETVAAKMLIGTPADNNLIAYQHKTKFASNFLKISYAPDPSEDLASRLAPVTTVAALVIALLYGVIKLSFGGAVNTLALITALSVPVSTLLAVNVPLRSLCKKLTGYGAMLAGYPSVKQFCDSAAIMMDAEELFPADSIDLEGIKTFEEYNVDESLLCGIAVLKEARNPIAKAFESVVTETEETLPEVESVLYEDELGLVGWINGERILVGSRRLMEKYSVEIPEADDYDEKYDGQGRQITYLSRAGRPIAVLVTRYRPDPELQAELQRAEANGISFLIRTTDYNINDDLVAKLYTLFYRSIKVLPTGLGNELKEAQGAVENKSRCYLITHGKTSGLARAVSGCVRIKQNISLAIVIQVIAVVLGLLIAVPVVLYANIGVMGALEVLIYALFWAIAAVAAPAIQKP